MSSILRFLIDESGPTAVEYAVLLALIIGTCVTAISTFGMTANASWTDTKTKLNSSMNH